MSLRGRGGPLSLRGARRIASRAVQALETGGVRGLAAAVRDGFRTRHETISRQAGALKRRALEFGIRPYLLRPRVDHLHGPARIEYGPEDLLVITVVRNGASYVPAFVEHYQALGAVHCVFLDNGSTDGTVERLRAYPRVTVLQTHAPYEKYENTMKRYLAERFSQRRWHLCADIDELFDYPLSDRLPLCGFLRYLNARAYTAVVTQMLDMFADAPLTEPPQADGGRLTEQYPYYDVSAVDRRPYEWSEVASPAIHMHWGGIRRTAFGTDNGLTKAALVRMDGRVRPFVEWHQVTGARVADVTGVFRHYPFAGRFADKVRDAVRTGRYGETTTDEYRAYARTLTGNPRLNLRRPTAQRYTGLGPLIDDGFVAVSDAYVRFVDAFQG